MDFRALIATCLISLCFGEAVFAQATVQETDLLTIGSQAPELDIEHWVQDGNGKFTPVTSFEPDKVYVIAFWATWCDQCVGSLPVLGETQKKFADNEFQLITVSEEDLQSVNKFLETPVRFDKETTYQKMTDSFCVTTDPDRSVQQDYLNSAGQNRIPTAFIVGKTGLIEWIGHPLDKMDEALGRVIADDWNRETFALQFKAKQEEEALLSRLGRKLQQGDVDEVIGELTTAIEGATDPAIVARLSATRARVRITTGAAGAAGDLTSLTEESDNASQLNEMAWAVVQLKQVGTQVSDELVNAAMKAARRATELRPEAGEFVESLAHLEHLCGNLDQAINLAEKAIELNGEQSPQINKFLEELKKKKAVRDEK